MTQDPIDALFDEIVRDKPRAAQPAHARQRSRPGEGERVRLYVVNMHGLASADLERMRFCPSDVFCWMPHAEDFSTCRWPVVVKAKRQVTQAQLVQHLRYVADQ